MVYFVPECCENSEFISSITTNYFSGLSGFEVCSETINPFKHLTGRRIVVSAGCELTINAFAPE
jgi:hypothetical protein